MRQIAVITLAACVALGALYSVAPIGNAAPRFAAFASLQSALDFVVPPSPRVPTMIYRVRRGDTLQSIATRFHTDADAILGLNQLTAGDDITVGEALRVPAPPTPTPLWRRVLASALPSSTRSYSSSQSSSSSQSNSFVQSNSYVQPNGNASNAIAWAMNQLGSQNWDFHCELFVENAYGTSGRYLTAQDSYYALHISSSWSPDIGALVWFAPNAGNQWDGHVGIYIGQGNFISATTVGVEIHSLTYWNEYVAPYEGWGNAPSSW
jgi:hypothetical protein